MATQKELHLDTQMLIVFVVLLLILVPIFHTFFPFVPVVPESRREEPVCEYCKTMKSIEASKAWIITHRFPFYASRFEYEMVNPLRYVSKLPRWFSFCEKALKITDTETGNVWVSNGFYPLYRVL